MNNTKKLKKGLLAIGLLGLFAAPLTAMALPALQLGSGGTSGWSYDTSDQTWVTAADSFTLAAYANSTSGNGDYAWDSAAQTQTAYLVVAAAPKTDFADGDVFDVSVTNDGLGLNVLTSGWGNPPLEDPNSLSGHGIYNTYFEIYAFDFDGLMGTISDTQPGQTGTGDGFEEFFNININSMASSIDGIHMDLFTISGDGIYDPLTQDKDKNLVYSFAPYSHDAEAIPTEVSEPATFLLLGMGLLGLAAARRRVS